MKTCPPERSKHWIMNIGISLKIICLYQKDWQTQEIRYAKRTDVPGNAPQYIWDGSKVMKRGTAPASTRKSVTRSGANSRNVTRSDGTSVNLWSGNEKMSRAVGNALHKNPAPLNIPCYRVVNSRGELSGEFAFGGKNVQAELLRKDGIEVIDGKVDLDKYGMK